MREKPNTPAGDDGCKLSSAKRASRRRLLSALIAAPVVIVPGRAAFASSRQLSFYHTHTGEKLSVTYRVGGRYEGDVLDEVNWFLRDFRTGESHAINPRLLDALYEARFRIGGGGEYQIISGYRSPATNEMLRSRSANSGVARKSFHMTGNAIDVRLTGVDTSRLRRAAVSLRFGGVGYYANSDFVHIDTGRVRAW